MRNLKYLLYVLSCVMLFHSCLIENDMSYPRVSAEFTAFEVEGQESVTIDAQKRTIDIVLSETADITDLRITNIGFTEQTRCTPALSVGSSLDLTEPDTVSLSIYQDYEWIISATQPIERYIRCTGQIGDAVLDVVNHKAQVYISAAYDLTKVTFQDMKLEPETSVILGYVENVGTAEESVHNFEFPLELDCTLRRYFDISYQNEVTRWEVNVFLQDIEMAVTSVIPWCYSADISGEFDGASATPRLEYRSDASSEWSSFDGVTANGTILSAKLSGLTQGTTYHVRFASDSSTGEETTFTTGTPEQIDNMGFDQWYQNTDGTWFPNLNETIKIWDTANGGTALLKKNPTVPEYSFLATADTDNTAAARLESMNVAKFAAGNIYLGEFVSATFSGGVGAILKWGTPFTGRPSALKGYYAYSPETIGFADSPYESLKGTMDKCQILVILTDWSEPFTINTAKGIFVDQTQANKSIIAYGKLESDEDTGGAYKEFTLPLEYWRPDATPTYAVVVACASYKGDYFTGGLGSVMYVDEFEFVYE